jgi:hypothetical protein
MSASFRMGPLLVAAGLLLVPATATGWATSEHQQLGRTAYAQACREITAEVTARASPAPSVRTRAEMACGRNADALADIYGDATALAGDFLGEPSEFLSQAGAWRFKSKKSYYLLALENSAHFNPMSTQSWADFHGKAVDEALAGARAEGLETVRRFKLAVQESAETGAKIKFLSLEPLIGPLGRLSLKKINWVIVGGESGPGARPVMQEWVTDIRDQCLRAKVPFFFKQWGGVQKKRAGRTLEGRTWDEMPRNLVKA